MKMGRDERQAERRERVDAQRRAETHSTGFTASFLALPEGRKLWAPKEAGVTRIEVIPYRVGKGNRYADPGKLHYELTFFKHNRIGANEDGYVCSAKTFNRPCFICEERGRLAKDAKADAQLIKALQPKERQLFNILDHDMKSDGIQIFEYSFHNFGKLLDKRVKGADPDSGWRYFSDPVDGFTLRVDWSKESMGQYSFLDAASIDFVARAKQLPDRFFAEAVRLEDILVEVPYNKLKAIFLQVDEEELAAGKTAERTPGRRTQPAPSNGDEWDDAPAPTTTATQRRAAAPPPAADDEPDWDDEPAAPAPAAAAPKRTRPKPAPEPAPAAADEEWDDEPVPAAAPAPAAKPKATKPKPAPAAQPAPAPAADEEWEDWDDQAAPAAAPAKPAKPAKTTAPVSAADDDWD